MKSNKNSRESLKVWNPSRFCKLPHGVVCSERSLTWCLPKSQVDPLKKRRKSLVAACLLACVRIDESISSSMVSCRCQLAGTCGLPSRGGSRSRPRCFPATTDRGWGRPWLPCLLFRSVQVTAIVSATPPKHGDFLLGETKGRLILRSPYIQIP